MPQTLPRHEPCHQKGPWHTRRYGTVHLYGAMRPKYRFAAHALRAPTLRQTTTLRASSSRARIVLVARTPPRRSRSSSRWASSRPTPCSSLMPSAHRPRSALPTCSRCGARRPSVLRGPRAQMPAEEPKQGRRRRGRQQASYEGSDEICGSFFDFYFLF